MRRGVFAEAELGLLKKAMLDLFAVEELASTNALMEFPLRVLSPYS